MSHFVTTPNLNWAFVPFSTSANFKAKLNDVANNLSYCFSMLLSFFALFWYLYYCISTGKRYVLPSFSQSFDGLESLVTEKTHLFVFFYISLLEDNKRIQKDTHRKFCRFKVVSRCIHLFSSRQLNFKNN